MKTLKSVLVLAAVAVLGIGVVWPGTASATTYGPYRLKNAKTFKCMSVRAPTLDGRTLVDQHECDYDPQHTAQKFSLFSTGGWDANHEHLTYYLKSPNGKCVTIENPAGVGSPTVQKTCASLASQKFSFVYDDPWYPTTHFRIVAQASGMSLQVDCGCTNEWALVSQWTYGLSTPEKDHFYWYAENY